MKFWRYSRSQFGQNSSGDKYTVPGIPKRVLATWIVVWLVGGVLGGVLLSMAEPGHLPRPVLPPLLGAAGILAGTVGGLFRCLLPVPVQRGTGRRLVAEMLIGAGIGLLVGTGLWRLGIGLSADVALSCGAVLGTFSGLGLGRNAG